jgi:peptidoglycan hydrolase-like protein with peptidoglycan-binding domain
MESESGQLRKMTLPWVTAALIAVVGGAVAPAPAEAKFGDRALKKGDSGREVKVLQRWLTLVGFETDADGQFGAGTVKALKAYERSHELAVDGKLSTSDAAALRRDAYEKDPPGEQEPSSTSTSTEPSASAEGGASAGSDDPSAEPTTEPEDGTTTPAPAGAKATLAEDGRTAVAPAGAPPAVAQMIEAANEITTKPYKYGGGHGKFKDSGYDCSGAVSYALHGADLLDEALDSSGLAAFGESGKGEWVTIYGKSSHAYVVIAGLRFDTSGSGTRGEGPRWRTEKRSGSGYAVRHPEGL